MDTTVQDLNKAFSLLEAIFRQYTNKPSRGIAQMRALAAHQHRMSGGKDYDANQFTAQQKAAVERVAGALKGDAQIQQMDALSSVIADTQNRVQESTAIFESFVARKEAIEAKVKENMMPKLDRVFKTPEEAYAQFERVANSEDPRNLVNEMMKARYGDKGNTERFKDLYDMVDDMKQDGIEIKGEAAGGKRIFAMKVMAKYPEIFGQCQGGKTLLGKDNKERQAALEAAHDIASLDPHTIAVEDALNKATMKLELLSVQLERTKANAEIAIENAKAGMEQIEADRMQEIDDEMAAAAGASALKPGQPEAEAAVEVEAEVEEAEVAAAAPEAEAEVEVEAEAEVDVEAPAAEPKAEKAAATSAKPTLNLSESQILDGGPILAAAGGSNLAPDIETDIGGIDIESGFGNLDIDIPTGGRAAAREEAAEEPTKERGPSLFDRIGKGLRGFKDGIARKYEEVKQGFSFREDPVLVLRDRVEPHFGEGIADPDYIPTDEPSIMTGAEVEAEVEVDDVPRYNPPEVKHDRIMDMRALYNDGASIEQLRANLDHEVEAYNKEAKTPMYVPHEIDGKSVPIPAQYQPHYEELAHMAAFEETGELDPEHLKGLVMSPEELERKRRREAGEYSSPEAARMMRRRGRRAPRSAPSADISSPFAWKSGGRGR